MGKKPVPVKNVAVTINGTTHQGTYFVQSKIVHVQSSFGNKTTQVGGSPPQAIARLLLSEMVRSAR